MDLKKYLRIDDEKVFKSLQNEAGLMKLNAIFPNTEPVSDMEFWSHKFSYCNTRTNLENFLLYRAANAFGLYSSINDADITEPALHSLKKKLLAIDEVKTVKVGKEISANEKLRAFQVELMDGDIMYLESDTAHSLMRDLGAFMREMIPKVENLMTINDWPEQTYIKLFGLNKDGSYEYKNRFKLFYFYLLINAFKEKLTDKNDWDRFEALEKRAGEVHTFENMIVVPYGYNSKRGIKLNTHLTSIPIKDDLQLTMQDFQEMIEDDAFTTAQFNKRLGNTKCTLKSVEFLLKHRESLFHEVEKKYSNLM